MPLECLASHPHTSSRHLHMLATATRPPGEGTEETTGAFHPGDTRIRQALASNPHVPPADIHALLRYDTGYIRDLATRPGLSVADLLTYGERHGVLTLLDMLETYPDTDGELARHVMATTSYRRVHRHLLHTTTVPPDVRATAALRLAPHVDLEDRDLADIADVARHQPHLIPALLATAGTHRLRTVLSAAAQPTTPGTAHWYAQQDVSTALAYLATDNTAVQWRRALTQTPDPHNELASAALASHHHPDLSSFLILTAPVSAPALAQQAILSHLDTHGALTHETGRFVVARHLATSTLHLATTYAPYAQTNAEFHALLTRTDLPPATLGILTATVLRDSGTYDLQNPTNWGAALATHPNATPTQRRQGLTLTTTPHTTAIATAGQHLIAGTPADAGNALPCDALRDATLRQLPPIAALLTAALTAAQDTLANDAVTSTLIALAPMFRGTVGELLNTAATVAQ